MTIIGGVSMMVTASHVSSSSFLLVSASAERRGARRQRRRAIANRSRVRQGGATQRRAEQPQARSDALARPAAGASGCRRARLRRCAWRWARTAASTLGVANDVRHASLEAHEGRQVRRLARVILGEAVSCRRGARQRPAVIAAANKP